jgi:aspartate 1-decarboxylase
MLRSMLVEAHHARVTEDLHYVGSVTIDADLLARGHPPEREGAGDQQQQRRALRDYVRGRGRLGVVCMNAAAPRPRRRHGHLAAFGLADDRRPAHRPKVLFLDGRTRHQRLA